MDTNTVAVITEFGNKVDGYIAVLAEKMGVAADQFWPILMKQQALEGWMGLVAMGLPIVLLGACCLACYLLREIFDDCEFTAKTFAFIAFVVVGFCAVIGSVASVSDNLTLSVGKITNPEYYAVQSVVKMVNK